MLERDLAREAALPFAYHDLSALAAEEMKKEGRRSGPPCMLFKPVFTFLKMFLVRQGFRDGIHGLVISLLYSFYTFSKYAKLWEMREKK